MTMFYVSAVIDGDTFQVQKGWTWKNQSGDRVRPTGYDTPERGQPGYAEATRKLRSLILNKQVDIRKAHRVDRGRLVADVYYQGRNLASYFPAYKA